MVVEAYRVPHHLFVIARKNDVRAAPHNHRVNFDALAQRVIDICRPVERDQPAWDGKPPGRRQVVPEADFPEWRAPVRTRIAAEGTFREAHESSANGAAARSGGGASIRGVRRHRQATGGARPYGWG